MLVTLKNGMMFGWGEHARELGENAPTYGTRMLSVAEAQELVALMKAKGWRPFWKRTVTERVVFLVNPAAKWRQSVGLRGYEGCTLQAAETEALPEVPPVAEKAETAKAETAQDRAQDRADERADDAADERAEDREEAANQAAEAKAKAKRTRQK